MKLCSFGLQLCWSHLCSTCHKSDIMLHSRVTAEQWLASFRSPLFTISQHEACRESCNDYLNRLSDQDVIREVALQLASGWLRACDDNWTEAESHAFTSDAIAGDSAGQAGNSAPPPMAKPFPMQERKARQAQQSAPAPKQPQETELLTFAENLNVQAQVLALTAAAAKGVPFCQLCAAAAASRQQSAEAIAH